MILYTLYKNSYIDIAHLESTKGIHVMLIRQIVVHVHVHFV